MRQEAEGRGKGAGGRGQGELEYSRNSMFMKNSEKVFSWK
jgi:hypothetical protein